jgi:hypothetical protein
MKMKQLGLIQIKAFTALSVLVVDVLIHRAVCSKYYVHVIRLILGRLFYAELLIT